MVREDDLTEGEQEQVDFDATNPRYKTAEEADKEFLKYTGMTVKEHRLHERRTVREKSYNLDASTPSELIDLVSIVGYTRNLNMTFAGSVGLLDTMKSLWKDLRPFRKKELHAVIDLLSDMVSYYEDVIFSEEIDAEKHGESERRKLVLHLYIRQDNRCIYCQKPGNSLTGPDGRPWQVDHMYPRVRGGDSKKDNLVLSCATCNAQKGKFLLADFLRMKNASERPI